MTANRDPNSWDALREDPNVKKAATTEGRIRGLDKRQSEFFAAVRTRGMLNATFSAPEHQFLQNHPELGVRWEYYPPSGYNQLVVAREALGFRVVDASELADPTPTQEKSGPVRVGDMVMMCGPKELIAFLEAEDARAAYEDWKLSETTYKDYIRSVQVKLRDGTVQSGTPLGNIRRGERIIEGIAEAPQELVEEVR